MKRQFRPVVVALEDRLALTTMSAAATAAASKAIVGTTPTTTAPLVPVAVATTTLTHLYQDTFGRNPDGVALAGWLPALEAGATLAQLETQLVISPEFIGNHVSAAATPIANETSYISALYSTVLGRAADSGGLSFWVNELQSGTLSVSQVGAAFTSSPEAATSSTSILSRDSFSTLATTAINGMYQSTLGRKADGVGIAALLPAMQAGMTMKQMATTLVTSSEYLSKYITAAATPIANEISYVSALYSTILGRAADSTGLNFWVGELQSGALSVAQVAAAFSNSPEAATSATSIFAKNIL